MSSKKENKEELKNWSSGLEGKCRIFANEIEYGKGKNKKSFMKFQTSISSKNEDDEYVNMYVDVQFKKDENPDVEDGENLIINIIDGFLTNYEYESKNDTYVRLKLVVLDYDVIEDEEPKSKTNSKKKKTQKK